MKLMMYIFPQKQNPDRVIVPIYVNISKILWLTREEYGEKIIYLM